MLYASETLSLTSSERGTRPHSRFLSPTRERMGNHYRAKPCSFLFVLTGLPQRSQEVGRSSASMGPVSARFDGVTGISTFVSPFSLEDRVQDGLELSFQSPSRPSR